jgi:hypothetical protein
MTPPPGTDKETASDKAAAEHDQHVAAVASLHETVAANSYELKSAVARQRRQSRHHLRSLTELAIIASTQTWSGSWSPSATVVVA